MSLTYKQQVHLQRAVNLASVATWAGEICGLALALLRFAGLDVENGYFITPEKGLVAEGRRRLEIQLHGHKVLMIECTTATNAPKKMRQMAEGYMQDKGFPNGMIMFPERTVFLSLNVENANARVQTGVVIKNVTGFETIVDEMAKMRIPELENLNDCMVGVSGSGSVTDLRDPCHNHEKNTSARSP